MGGGVAIAIRKSLKYRVLTLTDALWKIADFEIVAVEIFLGGDKKLIVVSVYRAPNFRTGISVWNVLFKELSELSKNNHIFLGGDFNAQSPVWGSNSWNSSGRALNDCLVDFNMIILNNGSPTYICPNRNFNVLDLTFVDSGLASSCSYSVTDDLLGSDHLIIDTVISGFSECPKDRRPSLKLNKVDWVTFNALMKGYKTAQAISVNNCISEYFSLCRFILVALGDSGAKGPNNPVQVHRKTRAGNLWWNENCSEAIKSRRKAFRAYKLNNSIENQERWVSEDKRVEAILKREKNLSFKKFTERVNPEMPLKEIWDTVRKFNGNFHANVHVNNIDNLDALKQSVDKLAPPSTTNFVFPNFPARSNRGVARGIWLPISFHELNNIIGKLNLNSAAGRDLISNSVISNLPHNVICILVNLFNKFMYYGVVPSDWCNFDVCLLPKATGGFRPISLAPCMLKIFERCIKNRLDYFMEVERVISGTQFGFRKARSCLDNTAILTSDIYNSFSKGEVVAAAFLNIEGAYDNVIPSRLIENLRELRLPNKIKKKGMLISILMGLLFADEMFLKDCPRDQFSVPYYLMFT